ncbi:MAG: hypothetical protein WCP10_15165 [Desulfuromonadales bacterium]
MNITTGGSIKISAIAILLISLFCVVDISHASKLYSGDFVGGNILNELSNKVNAKVHLDIEIGVDGKLIGIISSKEMHTGFIYGKGRNISIMGAYRKEIKSDPLSPFESIYNVTKRKLTQEEVDATFDEEFEKLPENIKKSIRKQITPNTVITEGPEINNIEHTCSFTNTKYDDRSIEGNIDLSCLSPYFSKINPIHIVIPRNNDNTTIISQYNRKKIDDSFKLVFGNNVFTDNSKIDIISELRLSLSLFR